jgi:hypothetical protein
MIAHHNIVLCSKFVLVMIYISPTCYEGVWEKGLKLHAFTKRQTRARYLEGTQFYPLFFETGKIYLRFLVVVLGPSR